MTIQFAQKKQDAGNSTDPTAATRQTDGQALTTETINSFRIATMERAAERSKNGGQFAAPYEVPTDRNAEPVAKNPRARAAGAWVGDAASAAKSVATDFWDGMRGNPIENSEQHQNVPSHRHTDPSTSKIQALRTPPELREHVSHSDRSEQFAELNGRTSTRPVSYSSPSVENHQTAAELNGNTPFTKAFPMIQDPRAIEVFSYAYNNLSAEKFHELRQITTAAGFAYLAGERPSVDLPGVPSPGVHLTEKDFGRPGVGRYHQRAALELALEKGIPNELLPPHLQTNHAAMAATLDSGAGSLSGLSYVSTTTETTTAHVAQSHRGEARQPVTSAGEVAPVEALKPGAGVGASTPVEATKPGASLTGITPVEATRPGVAAKQSEDPFTDYTPRSDTQGVVAADPGYEQTISQANLSWIRDPKTERLLNHIESKFGPEKTQEIVELYRTADGHLVGEDHLGTSASLPSRQRRLDHLYNQLAQAESKLEFYNQNGVHSRTELRDMNRAMRIHSSSARVIAELTQQASSIENGVDINPSRAAAAQRLVTQRLIDSGEIPQEFMPEAPSWAGLAQQTEYMTTEGRQGEIRKRREEIENRAVAATSSPEQTTQASTGRPPVRAIAHGLVMNYIRQPLLHDNPRAIAQVERVLGHPIQEDAYYGPMLAQIQDARNGILSGGEAGFDQGRSRERSFNSVPEARNYFNKYPWRSRSRV